VSGKAVVQKKRVFFRTIRGRFGAILCIRNELSTASGGRFVASAEPTAAVDNSALQTVTHSRAPVVASVSWLRCSRFAQETVQFSTGGIQRVLLRFGNARPHQRSTIVLRELSQGVLDVFLGQLVVVTAPDQFAAERPEVVAMPADGCLGQALVQQMEKERREHLKDLLAHEDGLPEQVARDGSVHHLQDRRRQLGLCGQRQAQENGQPRLANLHPLAHRHARNDIVDQVRCGLGHALDPALRA